MFIGRSGAFNRSCNVLKVNPSGKNSIRCQMYAKTEDHIELKLYFNSRHPHHRFSATSALFMKKSMHLDQFMTSEGSYILILHFTSKMGQSVAQNRNKIF